MGRGEESREGRGCEGRVVKGEEGIGWEERVRLRRGGDGRVAKGRGVNGQGRRLGDEIG